MGKVAVQQVGSGQQQGSSGVIQAGRSGCPRHHDVHGQLGRGRAALALPQSQQYNIGACVVLCHLAISFLAAECRCCWAVGRKKERKTLTNHAQSCRPACCLTDTAITATSDHDMSNCRTPSAMPLKSLRLTPTTVVILLLLLHGLLDNVRLVSPADGH